MASGKNHDKSIYFGTPVVGICIGYYLTPMLGLIAASSHLLGVLLSPVAIAFIKALPPLQMGREFWYAVASVFIGIEMSALNHLLLDGLLIPLPKGVKARLRGD